MSAKAELEWRLVAKDSASDAVHRASKAYQDLEKRLERAESQLEKTAQQLEKSRLAAKRSKKDINDNAKAWSGLTESLREVREFLGPMAKAGLVGAGVGLGVTYWLKKTAEDIDSISKTSDRLGITTEALSSMGAAAKLAGVESNTLELAIQRMARRIGDASRGFGEATKAFSELGIKIQDIKDLRAEEQFIRIKRALEGVENTNRRLSLGAQIFDSEGIRVLQMSADSIEEIVELTEEFGYSFSRIDGAKVEAANDALAKLQIALNGLARVAVVEFAPAFQGAFDDVLETLRELGGGDLRKGVSRFFLEMGETVQIAAVRAKGEFVAFKETIQEVADAITLIPKSIETGFATAGAAAKAASPAFRAMTQAYGDVKDAQSGPGAEEFAAQIDREIAAIKEATEARRVQLGLEKDITAEAEKRLGIVKATIIGPGGQRANWPSGQSYQEAYDAAFGQKGSAQDAVPNPLLTRIFSAQQYLAGVGGSRVFLSQWLELGRKAAKSFTDGVEVVDVKKSWFDVLSDSVTTLNIDLQTARFESMWERIADAGTTAFEKIRAASQKQHEESIQDLIEQRLFYQSIGDTIGYGIVDSIEAAIDGTGEWKDVLRQTLLDVRRLFLDQAMRAILGDAIKGTGLFGLFLNPVPSAQGNVFSRGDVVPFAQGGIVSRPTLFPMTGGRTGLMGEAGEEAVVPLRRGPSGRLGIDAYGAGGGGQTNNTFQISAVDAPSFVRLLNSPDGQRWFQATFGRMQQRRIA